MARFCQWRWLLLVLLTGCGVGGSRGPKEGLSHVKLLASLYMRASRELGHPPKNEEEFKAAIQKANVPLEALKVNNLDELFESERDGRPLVVLYGSSSAGTDVIVYEQTGVDGKRLVGHSIGSVEEVDEAKFRELVPINAQSK
jgi:hypothetical protein